MTDYIQYVIDHSNFAFATEMVDSAGQQLADMYLTIQNLGADLEEMAAERDAIANFIDPLDEGTAPDNLAARVEYFMEHEYYPAVKLVGDKMAEIKSLKAERDAIAKSISVTLDDGTAPDNLADHVELLMLQEYYPAIKKVSDMATEIKSLKEKLAACQQDAITGERE